MTVEYYRTERTIAIRGIVGIELDIRTYTEATSEAEARVLSRPIALAAAYPGKETEILGREYVVAVPGVVTPRPPEVRRDGRWEPISAQCQTPKAR